MSAMPSVASTDPAAAAGCQTDLALLAVRAQSNVKALQTTALKYLPSHAAGSERATRASCGRLRPRQRGQADLKTLQAV